MNIFAQELRMTWRSAALWSGVLLLIMALFMALYPAFARDMTASQHMIENFPPAVKAAFGLSLSAFTTFLGFYAYTFTYVTLAGAVQAMNLGLGLISRETSAKTTDFLLTKPVTRTKVFISKLAAALVLLIATGVVLTVGTFILARIMNVGDFSTQTFLLVAFSFTLVQLCFFSIGAFASLFFRRIRSVISISLGLVLGFFAIGIMSELVGDTALYYLTPFKYFIPLHIVQTGGYELSFVWTGLAVIILPLIACLIVYQRRDVRAAE